LQRVLPSLFTGQLYTGQGAQTSSAGPRQVGTAGCCRCS